MSARTVFFLFLFFFSSGRGRKVVRGTKRYFGIQFVSVRFARTRQLVARRSKIAGPSGARTLRPVGRTRDPYALQVLRGRRDSARQTYERMLEDEKDRKEIAFFSSRHVSGRLARATETCVRASDGRLPPARPTDSPDHRCPCPDAFALQPHAPSSSSRIANTG